MKDGDGRDLFGQRGPRRRCEACGDLVSLPSGVYVCERCRAAPAARGPCPECDGTGLDLDGGPCPECDGTGTAEEPPPEERGPRDEEERK